jgi:PAS domain S-box-containing protein
MIFVDAQVSGRPILYANDSFLDLLRYFREDIIGVSFEELLASQISAEDLVRVQAVLDEPTQDTAPEVHFEGKEGPGLWLSVHVVPVREDGVLTEHFISFVDRTEHKREKKQLQLLVEELNHRVKNTLATVQAIVSSGFRSSGSIVEVNRAITSRLTALARSHGLLSRSNWVSAGIREVVRNALEPFGISDGRAERFEIRGPNFPVTPTATVAISTVINELATNAVKYGAFSNDAGTVEIEMALLPREEEFKLHWKERGGPPVKPPEHAGIGTKTIQQGLPYQLGGAVRMIFAPEGVECVYKVPASKLKVRSTGIKGGEEASS